jgi:hypothetical protein
MFHKRQGISLLAVPLLASQDGLGCMELVKLLTESFEIPRMRLDDNINVDLKGIGCEERRWIELTTAMSNNGCCWSCLWGETTSQNCGH